jgi:hypothetical protein
MVFAVVVDVPPVEATAAARTLATCNAALGAGQCALAGAKAGTDAASLWYALVRYGSGGQLELTIELYERTRAGSRVASSELEFKERDPPEERWASVGVVVAALVLAQPAKPAIPKRVDEQPAPALAASARPVALVPPVAAVRRPPWLRLDLGISAGSEVRSAPLRVGPLGRFGIAFANLPLFAFASGAYTVGSSGSTDLTWLTGSLGAGVRAAFAQQRAALEVRAEVVIEELGIQATDGERSESARRTRFGPRLGLDLSGYWAKNWALVVGAEAGVLGPRVVIDLPSQGQTEELPPFYWGLLSAVRYDFR